MKTEWLCDNCYKQKCLDFGAREIAQYTDINNFNVICPNCKINIGIHHIDRYKMCINCKFWRHIRNEDYKDWKGPHGECKKITDTSQDEENAWIDKMMTYVDVGERLTEDKVGNKFILESLLITKPNFGCNLFIDKESL